MKRVLAVVVLSLVVCGIACASETNWRFYLKADDGAGSNSAAQMTIGVAANSVDGNYSDQFGSDANDLRFPAGFEPDTAKAVEGLFGNMLWNRDVKSPRPPWTHPTYYDPSYPPSYHRKVWELRVGGLSDADTVTPIRLQFKTIGSAWLPPATLSGKTMRYYLKMVDNRGVAGAPANGTIWGIPIPTAHSATPYYSLTLPTLKVSSSTEGALINEGYKMEFFQTPEPTSIMALGAGLMALAGYGLRSRRR